jgi:uncharacterized protein YqjF (DUF2071 family)
MNGVHQPFLTADWRYLVMLNYEIDPAVLALYRPAGVELDAWDGHTYASLVGFLFLNTRLLGLSVPYHRDFEEVNLRFYVRRKGPEGWRRGVVFVKEIVPRRAIAAVARYAYGERYAAMPMAHRIELEAGRLRPGGSVEYSWRSAGGWNRLCAHTQGDARLPEPGSEAAFITEHYWGYAAGRDGYTLEYRVEHRPWRVWQVGRSEVEIDIAGLYGSRFRDSLSKTPSSAFVAEGSAVTVFRGYRLVT